MSDTDLDILQLLELIIWQDFPFVEIYLILHIVMIKDNGNKNHWITVNRSILMNHMTGKIFIKLDSLLKDLSL